MTHEPATDDELLRWWRQPRAVEPWAPPLASFPTRAGAAPAPAAAQVLRAARGAARLSQRELAAAAGTSRSAVGAIESGRRDPTSGLLDRLLRACGCVLAVARLEPTVDDETGIEVLRIVAITAESELWYRDAAGRHYPAHLDLRSTDVRPYWWGDLEGVWEGKPRRPFRTFELRRRYAWGDPEADARH